MNPAVYHKMNIHRLTVREPAFIVLKKGKVSTDLRDYQSVKHLIATTTTNEQKQRVVTVGVGGSHQVSGRKVSLEEVKMKTGFRLTSQPPGISWRLLKNLMEVVHSQHI